MLSDANRQRVIIVSIVVVAVGVIAVQWWRNRGPDSHETRDYARGIEPYFARSISAPNAAEVSVLAGVEAPSGMYGVHQVFLRSARAYLATEEAARSQEELAQAREDEAGGDRVTSCVNLDEHNDFSGLGSSFPGLEEACHARAAAFDALVYAELEWSGQLARECQSARRYDGRSAIASCLNRQ